MPAPAATRWTRSSPPRSHCRGRAGVERDRLGCLGARLGRAQAHGLNASGRSPRAWTPEHFPREGGDAEARLGHDDSTGPRYPFGTRCTVSSGSCGPSLFERRSAMARTGYPVSPITAGSGSPGRRAKDELKGLRRRSCRNDARRRRRRFGSQRAAPASGDRGDAGERHSTAGISPSARGGGEEQGRRGAAADLGADGPEWVEPLADALSRRRLWTSSAQRARGSSRYRARHPRPLGRVTRWMVRRADTCSSRRRSSPSPRRRRRRRSSTWTWPAGAVDKKTRSRGRSSSIRARQTRPCTRRRRHVYLTAAEPPGRWSRSSSRTSWASGRASSSRHLTVKPRLRLRAGARPPERGRGRQAAPTTQSFRASSRSAGAPMMSFGVMAARCSDRPIRRGDGVCIVTMTTRTCRRPGTPCVSASCRAWT